ncbi:BrnT family toxin [candidate division KSB1 bacterium]|nr:BrnT family toxin [candidate division KSB1 bacterium]
MDKLLLNCIAFDWDEGNAEKNWIRHLVTRSESEQVFFNEPLIMADDTNRSQFEKRWHSLGRTDVGRLLFIAVTIREELILVISARDMNKREREFYNEQIKKDTSI